jgi:hypothetical protein
MIDVKVRYNTQCTDGRSFWRILIEGVEYTCSNVVFEIPTTTTRDIVFDPTRKMNVDKHHISCKANNITWEGKTVIVA